MSNSISILDAIAFNTTKLTLYANAQQTAKHLNFLLLTILKIINIFGKEYQLRDPVKS